MPADRNARLECRNLHFLKSIDFFVVRESCAWVLDLSNSLLELYSKDEKDLTNLTFAVCDDLDRWKKMLQVRILENLWRPIPI